METSTLSTPTPASDEARRPIMLGRRQGLANRLRSELPQDRPQRADAGRERVAVALDDIVKVLGRERRRFFVS